MASKQHERHARACELAGLTSQAFERKHTHASVWKRHSLSGGIQIRQSHPKLNIYILDTSASMTSPPDDGEGAW